MEAAVTEYQKLQACKHTAFYIDDLAFQLMPIADLLPILPTCLALT